MKPESHLLGYDPAFLALRKKIYAESEPITVLDPDSGAELSELCLLSVYECLIHFKSLTHPSSYFSPSLRETSKWTPRSWQALFQTLRKTRGWTLSRFMMLSPEQSNTLRKRATEAGYLSMTTEECFRVIPGNQNYAQYLDKRSAKHNTNNRRCARKAERLGFVITDKLTVDEIADVYLRRRKSGPVRSEDDYSVTPQFIEFLTGLRTAYISEKRWIEYGVRDPEGRLIAFSMGFWDTNRVFYFFQTGYDPDHHALRPGSIVFDNAIERVLSEGCQFISFASCNDYLANYAPDSLPFHRVDVFNRTPKGLFLFAYRWLSNWRKTNEARLDRSKMAITSR